MIDAPADDHQRNHNQDDPGHLDAYDHCREQSDSRCDGEQTGNDSLDTSWLADDYPRRKSLRLFATASKQSNCGVLDETFTTLSLTSAVSGATYGEDSPTPAVGGSTCPPSVAIGVAPIAAAIVAVAMFIAPTAPPNSIPSVFPFAVPRICESNPAGTMSSVDPGIYITPTA